MKKLHQRVRRWIRAFEAACRAYNERRKSRLEAADFGRPFSQAQFVQPLGKID